MAFRCCTPVRKEGWAGRTGDALTQRERAVVQAFLDAVRVLSDSVDADIVRQLISRGVDAAMSAIDTGGFVTTLSPMVTAIQNELGTGAAAALDALPKRIVGEFQFDIRDPRALAWAQARAGELIVQITDAQRLQFRDVLARSVEQGWTVQQTQRELRQGLGLHSRWANAVVNARETELARLVKTGMSETLAASRADEFAARYREKLLRARAQNIARTEIARAANQGRWLSWAQGVEAGYIAPTAQKKWLTGPLGGSLKGKQVCDICAPLRDEIVAWDKPFSNGVMMPPAHPSCRCTAVVVPVSIDEVRQRLRDYNAQQTAQSTPAVPEQPAQPVRMTPSGVDWDEPVPTFVSTSEAEEWMRRKWGSRRVPNDLSPEGIVTPREIRYGDIHVSAAQAFTEELDYLFREYPATADRIKNLGGANAFGEAPNALAFARRTGDLHWNEGYYKTETWKNSVLSHKESNWLSSDYLGGIMHHEFGHHLHYVIEGIGHKLPYPKSYPNENYLRDGLRPILKRVLGLKGAPGMSGASTKFAVAPALSRYGTTNWYELIAESYGEVIAARRTGTVARPLASEIVAWCDAELAKAGLL